MNLLSYKSENNKENYKQNDSIFHYNLLEDTNNSLSNNSYHDFKFINFNDSIKEDYVEEDINLYNQITYSSINKEKLISNIKQNRGRKKIRSKSNKIHDKFKIDNIHRKIQIHYMNFIISFLNDVLNNLGYKQRLYYLDYRYKSNITNIYCSNLQKKSIEEILCSEISAKYKIKSKFINIKIVQEIKNYPIVKSILSENYLELFKRIYYKSRRKINLNYYGLNKEIILSKNVEMYQDLLNKSNDTLKNENYKRRMNECVARKFLLNSIFICN